MIDLRQHVELNDLLKALCDDTLSDEQSRRLEELLTGDADMQRYYVQYVTHHDLLRSLMRVESTPIPLEAPHAIVEVQAEQAAEPDGGATKKATAATTESYVFPRREAAGWGRYAAAAIVLLALGLSVALLSRPTEPARHGVTTIDTVATLSYAEQAVWAEASAEAMSEGATLEAGPVRLNTGEAQLVFDSGAVVTLLGHVRMTLTGANRCTLHEGRLLAYVPPKAVGFTVDTPEGAVVDHGTEFGLIVTPGGVEQVHVFRGSVGFTHGATDTPLVAGQAAIAEKPSGDIGNNGQAADELGVRLTAVDPSLFPRLPRWFPSEVKLIDRELNDSAAGSVWVLNAPLERSGVVTHWSFFDNDAPGRSVTPLILTPIDGGRTWRIVGIGQTRKSDGTGVQEFTFDLVDGRDRIHEGDRFGWKPGGVDFDNAGVIDYSTTTDRNVTWLGAPHTRIGVGNDLAAKPLPTHANTRTYSIRAKVAPLPSIEIPTVPAP
ncbi:MAG: hypothetical protein GC159_12365 [Phycisphaera sp.]|nr:hypothetical protein [Phycisphaera sp.]